MAVARRSPDEQEPASGSALNCAFVIVQAVRPMQTEVINSITTAGLQYLENQICVWVEKKNGSVSYDSVRM